MGQGFADFGGDEGTLPGGMKIGMGERHGLGGIVEQRDANFLPKRRVHLLDTLAGVVLSEAAVTAPLAVFVLYGAIAQLSVQWEEAAVLDGAGLLQVVGRVILPLLTPTVAATAVVLFVLDWNMLLVPLILTSGEIKTIPVAMSDFFTFERELDWPTAAAALIVSLGPVAVLVGLFHGVLDRFSLGAGTGA